MTWKRPATALAIALTAALAIPAMALATAPTTTPTVAPPVSFAAGTLCDDAILFENVTVKGHDSLFAPGPHGDQRFLGRGFGSSIVTDLDSGNTLSFKGGVRITAVFAPDGSYRVDGSGTDILAWYFPGDDSELGSGIFHVTGHITEWYAADGTFIRATASGASVNVCDALAD
jgi:hypothetical protein